MDLTFASFDIANISLTCFFASYLVAFALEVSRLIGRSKTSRALTLLFAIAGLCAHTLFLILRSQKSDLPPLVGSNQDWMLVLAWLMIMFYMVLTLLDGTLAVGAFILPVVLILIGAAYFMSDVPNHLLLEQHPLRMAHATLLVFGMSGVISGFVIGMMYLVQHRRLKRKHGQTGGFSMPSLERLSRWNRLSVMLSFPLLTLGMLTGVGLGMYSKKTAEPIRFLDPVIIGYGLVWLVMAVLFAWLVRPKPTAGKQVAWMTIWSFGFLLLTFIGLQVLNFDSWHG